VSLSKEVDDDLLKRARKHKAEIKNILLAVKRKADIKSPKVWKLKIRSGDGKSINSMTMIDPDRMSEVECKNHLARQFGIERVISFEVKL